MEANNKAATRGTPSPDRDCALDADGNLMDASQINFFNSPSDERPISGPGVTPSSPTPATKQISSRPQRNSNRTKYLTAIAFEKLDSDEDDINTTVCAPNPSRAAKRKKVQSDSDGVSEITSSISGTKRKAGPKPLLKKGKTTAVNRFLKKSDDVASQAAPPLAPTAVTTASGSNSQTHECRSSPPLPTTTPISVTPSISIDSASPSQTSSNDTEPANISVSISIDAMGASNRKSSADVAPLFKRLKRREEDGTVVWDNKYECIVCA